MSNVFVTDINGTGIYVVPGSDAALAAAEAGLAALVGSVPGVGPGALLMSSPI